MTHTNPSFSKRILSPAEKLAKSRQDLREALFAGGKSKFVNNTDEKTKKTKSKLASKSHLARNSIKQARTLAGAWLLNKWKKQPARKAAAVAQSLLERGIRKYPKHSLGVAAGIGALLAAWKLWCSKKTIKK